jgi:hypothetical protein
MSLDIFLASPIHLEKKSQCPHGIVMLHLPLHVVYLSFLLPFEPIPTGFQTQTSKTMPNPQIITWDTLFRMSLECPHKKKMLATLFFMDLSIVGFTPSFCHKTC